MSRIKRSAMTHKRHKRVLKQTKGYWGQRKNVFRRAKETLLRALEFAFISRKLRKRDYRALFISRISAGCKQYDFSYSRFVYAMKKLDVQLNRKMISQLAIFEPKAFEALVQKAKSVTP